MTKKELWEDVQKHDVEFKDFIVGLSEVFGKVELLEYERDEVKYDR